VVVDSHLHAFSRSWASSCLKSRLMSFVSFAEPPEIDLDASMRKLVVVRAGCPIRLFAIVRGRPAPKVTWRKVGIDNVVRKGQVDLVDTMAFLVIPNSTRDDSGKYSLTLVNPAGEKAVFVNVKVLGALSKCFFFSASKSNKLIRMLMGHMF
jgi:hypothetical protein